MQLTCIHSSQCSDIKRMSCIQ